MCLHASVLKKHISFLILSTAAAMYSPRQRCFVLALIGWLMPAWGSTTKNNQASVLNQFLRVKLAMWHKSYEVWHGQVV